MIEILLKDNKTFAENFEFSKQMKQNNRAPNKNKKIY